MSDAAPDAPAAVLKVKRDGPRGWHWIAASSYNPDIHELIDQAEPADAEKPKRGRPKKVTEA